MINICPNCKGIIGKETVCPKCGVNILDYKEELELKSAEPSGNIESNPPLLDKEPVDADRQSTSKVFVGITALVKCPACGRERVSDSAAACPECGFAVKAYFDKIRYDKEREAQTAAQEEMRKRRQEEYIARKQRRRKKLFGSSAKKATCIFSGCAFLVLVVVVGIFIHKEIKVSDAVRDSQHYFNRIQSSISELQNELDNIDYVDGSFEYLDGVLSATKKLDDIYRYKRLVDFKCKVSSRVIEYIDNYVKRETVYQSWDEYKNFLSENYLLYSDSVENYAKKSAERLVGANAYSSHEEKDKHSLIVSSKNCSYKGRYFIVSGTVTNNTTSTVKFVEVKTSLMDEDYKVIDTDTTYACGSEGLRPGESSKFECYLDNDDRIEYYRAEIYSYD